MGSSFFLPTVAAATAIGFFTLLRKFRISQENKDKGSSSSASQDPSALSSSSSRSPPYGTHHVFPSFHGYDVRTNFLSHIIREFRQKGITPFVDNEITRGESIAPELINAIRASKIAIVILSKNYASSTWCLEELAEIMKCHKESGLTVFSVFYDVDPSHVKKLTGDFGAVFKKTCKGRTKEDIQKWRQAFKEVATVAGYDSRSKQWENDPEMIDEIVTEITKRLIKAAPSRDLEGLIGMEAHMENMKQVLSLDLTDERRMVGITGPHGIGKSTIARVLHNQIFQGFEMNVFMKFQPSEGVIPSDDHAVKLKFEQQFVDQLMNREDIKIHYLGASQTYVHGKKLLIVLDGVEKLVQMLAMPTMACLGLGSRMIITTRYQRLLKSFTVDHIYNVDFPPDNEAFRIFCINAFGQDSPYDGFEDLAREVTRLAGRSPLELRVIGSHFRGLSKQDWESELLQFRVRLDRALTEIRLSY